MSPNNQIVSEMLEVDNDQEFVEMISTELSQLKELSLEETLQRIQELKAEVLCQGLEEYLETQLITSIDQYHTQINKQLVSGDSANTSWCDYDFDFQLDSNIPDIYSIWTEGTYLQFWEKVVFQDFFLLPKPEVQNKIAATLSLVNSNAIAPVTARNPVELPLGIAYLQGPPASGKSRILDLIGFQYPSERIAIIEEESTGTTIRDDFHDACYRGTKTIAGDTVYLYFPALGRVDNFAWPSMAGWGKFSKTFLKTYRSQCHGVGKMDMETKEKLLFHSHIYKVLTAVGDIGPTSERKAEIDSRLIKLRCRPRNDMPKSLNDFDWSALRTEYERFWDKDLYNTSFKPIYLEALRYDKTKIDLNPRRVETYLLLSVIGVYGGIWSCLDEALEHCVEHERYIQSTNVFIQDDAEEICDITIKGKLNAIRKLQAMDDYIPVDEYMIITFEELSKNMLAYSNGVVSLKRKGTLAQVDEYMMSKGWHPRIHKKFNGKFWELEEEPKA